MRVSKSVLGNASSSPFNGAGDKHIQSQHGEPSPAWNRRTSPGPWHIACYPTPWPSIPPYSAAPAWPRSSSWGCSPAVRPKPVFDPRWSADMAAGAESISTGSGPTWIATGEPGRSVPVHTSTATAPPAGPPKATSTTVVAGIGAGPPPTRGVDTHRGSIVPGRSSSDAALPLRRGSDGVSKHGPGPPDGPQGAPTLDVTPIEGDMWWERVGRAHRMRMSPG